MSHIKVKGIMQEIMDQQYKLDMRVIKEHDLYDNDNYVDLTVNFGDNRKDSLRFAYMVLKSTVKYVRTVGAKWWKKDIRPLTDGQFAQYKDDFASGVYNEDADNISNISMKNLAIIQELIELEQAVEENRPEQDIHDEYIDIIHFVVSLGLELGIDSEEKIRELYEKKNQINHQRINESY